MSGLTTEGEGKIVLVDILNIYRRRKVGQISVHYDDKIIKGNKGGSYIRNGVLDIHNIVQILYFSINGLNKN